MSLLKIEHLRKSYGSFTPIEDVSLEVEEGEVISIIGPSGTGKSTLLRCINQLVVLRHLQDDPRTDLVLC